MIQPGQRINGSQFLSVPGIYKIFSLFNGCFYIGQTECVHSRLIGHFKALSKGKHPNKQLQRDYDLYGAGNFTAEILEVIEQENSRRDREREIIEQCAVGGLPTYNLMIYRAKLADLRFEETWGVKYVR